ncbi:hypothetical protein BDK51DRAFT_30589 [Blyttiomyces helicus]|uniref:Uncharacterized protein n=1 Tax=Blyttiomyces helicus TaxID=388810 RepID=A0A4P9VXI6_9FUNG|nr:hypothetical protein BDK51DRAFT_30589 [Blyttiomyces helicus]|eukprot:RKO84424.1 hypothetical protein BDK51DRAFT_30589 [Blyttiomyces helicus]
MGNLSMGMEGWTEVVIGLRFVAAFWAMKVSLLLSRFARYIIPPLFQTYSVIEKEEGDVPHDCSKRISMVIVNRSRRLIEQKKDKQCPGANEPPVLHPRWLISARFVSPSPPPPAPSGPHLPDRNPPREKKSLHIKDRNIRKAMEGRVGKGRGGERRLLILAPVTPASDSSDSNANLSKRPTN